MAAIFPYKFQDDSLVYTTDPAVYKLHFGSKYFIWKGLKFKASVEQNLSDIQKLIHRPPAANHLFSAISSYLNRTTVKRCTVELVLQTDDVKQLLAKEQELLDQGRNDQNCLNVEFIPHIPKWMNQANEVPVIKTGSIKIPDQVNSAAFERADVKISITRPAANPVEKPAPAAPPVTAVPKPSPGRRPRLNKAVKDINPVIEATSLPKEQKEPVEPKNNPDAFDKMLAVYEKLKAKNI
jgi:hypothetical protein